MKMRFYVISLDVATKITDLPELNSSCATYNSKNQPKSLNKTIKSSNRNADTKDIFLSLLICM